MRTRLLTIALVSASLGGATLWAQLPAERTSAPDERVSAHDQVQKVVHNFAIANEFHYSENRRYTDDIVQLQERFRWTHADSVNLSIWVRPDGQGYQVVGTHVRFGLTRGCAIFAGDVDPVATPGGQLPEDQGRSRRIACDDFPAAQ